MADEVTITYDPDEVAPSQFTECPQRQEITIPFIIGIAGIAAGTLCVLWGWKAKGWRNRWCGIPILIVGILFAGTSSEDECRCPEFVYTGGALIAIGTVPLVAYRKPSEVGVPAGFEEPEQQP